MESNDAAQQLAEVDRLKARTARETLRERPWAVSVLAVATILFFSSYSIDSGWQLVLAPIAWTAFIFVWVRWLQSAGRARPKTTWDWRIFVGWGVSLPVVYLGTMIGEKVSWILAGLLMAGFFGALVAFARRLAAK